MTIPKIVHTFWTGAPNKFVERCFARMALMNPTWQLRIHTDGSEMDPLPGKQTLTPQQFSDWLRLCLLAKYGGVWLDASVVCVAALETWIDRDEERVIGFECPIAAEIMESWAFAARPRHPLILAWKREFARAIRMGFGVYKQTYPYKNHPIHKHMPYLTIHGAYYVVRDPALVVLLPVCGTGPLGYLCEYFVAGPKKHAVFLAVPKLFVQRRSEPLVKLRSFERREVYILEYVLPVMRGSTLHSLGMRTSWRAIVLYACLLVYLLEKISRTNKFAQTSRAGR